MFTRARTEKRRQTDTPVLFYVKCAAILALFLISILIVACGSTAGNANVGDPVVTVTIQMGQQKNTNSSALPKQWCGAWVTNTTPVYNQVSHVAVYAKFTQNVNGNPVGVDGANATATVMWGPGFTESYQASTTADGVAVFAIPVNGKANYINTSTLVTVTFTKTGMDACNVGTDQAAFFTLVMASPTAKPGNTPGAKQTPTQTPPGRPKKTVTPFPTFPIPSVTVPPIP